MLGHHAHDWENAVHVGIDWLGRHDLDLGSLEESQEMGFR